MSAGHIMGNTIGNTEGVIAIIGLAVLTVATRGFFFLTEREIPIPD